MIKKKHKPSGTYKTTGTDASSVSEQGYLAFRKKHPTYNMKGNTIKEYQDVLFALNRFYVNHAVETGDMVRWQHGMGDFGLCGNKINTCHVFAGPEKEKVTMLNHHTEGHVFRFVWDKTRCKLLNKSMWSMKPVRHGVGKGNKRLKEILFSEDGWKRYTIKECRYTKRIEKATDEAYERLQKEKQHAAG